MKVAMEMKKPLPISVRGGVSKVRRHPHYPISEDSLSRYENHSRRSLRWN